MLLGSESYCAYIGQVAVSTWMDGYCLTKTITMNGIAYVPTCLQEKDLKQWLSSVAWIQSLIGSISRAPPKTVSTNSAYQQYLSISTTSSCIMSNNLYKRGLGCSSGPCGPGASAQPVYGTDTACTGYKPFME